MRSFTGNLRNTVVIFVLLLTIAAGAARAEEVLRFANIFNDNIVLQCHKPAKIWGRAEPGAEVTVTFTEDRKFAEGCLEEAGPPTDADAYRVTQEVIEHNRPAFKPQTRKVRANDSGDWQVELDALSAGFTPKYLVAASGGTGAAVQNIVIGEVWVCAGQSNMVWSNFHTKDIETNAPDMPGLRYCRLEGTWYKPKEDLDRQARWNICDARARTRMSAIAYMFGRDLHRTLGVPVGMINVSRGGTTGQTWCTRDELNRIDSEIVKKVLTEYDAETAEWESDAFRLKVVSDWEAECEKVKAAHAAKVKQAEAEGKNPPKLRLPKKPGDPRAGWSPPAGMFNFTVWPISKSGVRGVLYHQGENNYFQGWTQYEHTFPAVIRSFRAAFGDDDLPFGIISLPGWGNYDQPAEVACVGSGYQSIRDIHTRTHERMKNTGLIMPTMAGNSYIHPADKEPVALLTVRWALAKVYGKEVYHAGPKLRKIEKAGNKMRVFYEVDPLRDEGFEGNKELAWWTATAVPYTGGDHEVRGFAIADKDKRWYQARAKVNQRDKCVEVWSDLVEEPVAVRYNFANWPRGNLVGEMNIPAPPFRSDDWPLARKVAAEPESGKKIGQMQRIAEQHAMDRQIRQAMLDVARWEDDLHMKSRNRPEANGPDTKLLSKAERIEQILSEFQDDEWMRRHIQKANPQVAKEIEQLQAQIKKLKAEIEKMEQ